MDKIHLYDKILSPMVTEKSTNLSEQNKIVFKVPAGSNKIGLQIKQKSMAWSDADKMDFIIFEMNIKNTSGNEINGLNFGIFTDWDIANLNENYAVYDSTTKTGYSYSSGGIPCLNCLWPEV